MFVKHLSPIFNYAKKKKVQYSSIVGILARKKKHF